MSLAAEQWGDDDNLELRDRRGEFRLGSSRAERFGSTVFGGLTVLIYGGG